MNQDIRLGRIAGIPVGMNWSVLFVVGLIVWEMSDLILPDYVKHASTATYWLVGAVATALFFFSLLAHEASHSVVAKREGIGVRRITLWLFGGVSELEGEALSPGADFRIAVVGPLTSFVLAAIFWGVAVVVQPAHGTTVVAAAAGWLGWTNLLLGAFNLLPGAPLDGGRVLRAAVWRRRGDRDDAAAAAARAGVILGFLLVAVGALEFIDGYLLGLWFVFLGIFLVQAARTEEGYALTHSALGDARVREIMSADPVSFSSSMTVAELLEDQLHLHHFNTFPLLTPRGDLCGLTTLGRIRRVPPDQRTRTHLVDVACALDSVPTASPDARVTDLLTRMQGSPDGRGLVLENGRLVGVVSPSDIARYVQLSLLRHGVPSR